MLKIAMFLAASLLSLLACQKPIDLGNLSFVGVASIGQVVRAAVNKDQIKMQLEGARSDTLLTGKLETIPNFKNFYTLKDVQGIKIAIVPEDLIMYRHDNLLGAFGFAVYSRQRPYKVADVAGIYNFVAKYSVDNILPRLSFGTFELRADNTWRSWKFHDGTRFANSQHHEGSWIDRGDGVILIFQTDKKPFAKLSLSGPDSGDLIIIDLITKNGIALGMKKKTISPGCAEGGYNVLSTNKNHIIKASVYDGIATHGKRRLAINYNQPWEGFIKDNQGEFVGIFSSKGSYVGINIGTISGSQYMFAAVKNR